MSLEILGGAALCLGAAAGTIAVAAKTAYHRQPQETPDVYGGARFMNPIEVEQSGLLVGRQQRDANGVYIGAWRDKKGKLQYLRDVSNGHVLVCAPTRSGKGVSCILPTLLSYTGSTIVNDEKGELYVQAAPWRQKHIGPVFRWEPGAVSDTSSWNPLLDVRLQTSHEVADTQNVSLMLIDIRGHGLDRLDHWQKAAVPLLAGMILYELYDGIATNRTPSLGDIAARFADYSANDLYEEMRDNTLLNGRPHLVVAAEGRAQLDRSDRERSSITSTLRTFFTLFTDPIVCANTSESDFRLDEIADQARPVTVFVTTLPVDTVRLRPLVRLFFTMMIRALMAPRLIYVDGQPQNPHRFNTLIAMDEFPSFGKLEEIEAALGRIAGWGGKFLLSVQDLTQLNGIYGLGHSIVANTHTRVFFPPNDLATAELLSKSTGTTTVATRHTTISGKRFGFLSQVTQSIQMTSKPLMTPGQVLTMRSPTKDEGGRITAPGDVLIFLTGQPPLRTEQLLSFQDDDFAARAATPWPPVSLLAPSPPLQLPWVPAMPPP